MKFLSKLIWPVCLVAIALGAAPLNAAFWQWSKTASSDASADPTINWAEGMSPSSVNDSARAMMARAAEYRDDISGSINTSGTDTAYTATTSQGFPTIPVDGQLLAITVHATNGVNPTLTVDGGTTYPIVTESGTGVASASLIAGTPYSMKFSVGHSAWFLMNFYRSPYNIPLGGLLPSTFASPPNSNFLKPYGQCISTTTYHDYWLGLGSPASGACPGGQFAIIDLRGRGLAGADNMGGVSAGRLTNAGSGVDGNTLLAVGGGQFQSILKVNLPNTTFAFTGNAGTVTVNSTGNNVLTGTYVGTAIVGTGASGPYSMFAGGASSFLFSSGSFTPSGTVSSGGSGQPLVTVPPVGVVNLFLRVL